MTQLNNSCPQQTTGPLKPNIGDIVYWEWLGRKLSGTVVSVHSERTQIIPVGKLVTRLGTPENPAIIIRYKNGNEILKGLRELTLSSP